MTPDNTPKRPEAGWHFDNSYTRLPEAFYVRQNPVPVRAPQLVVFNAALARSLGLSPETLTGDTGAGLFAGNTIPEGAAPLAQALQDTSSVISPCWATDGPYCWASRSHPRAGASTSSSRGPAGPPFRGTGTDGQPWAPCCGNTSSARPCTPWASPPPAAWRW